MVGTIEPLGTVKGCAATVCTVSTRASAATIGTRSRTQPPSRRFHSVMNPSSDLLAAIFRKITVMGMRGSRHKARARPGGLRRHRPRARLVEPVARRLVQHVDDVIAHLDRK